MSASFRKQLAQRNAILTREEGSDEEEMDDMADLLDGGFNVSQVQATIAASNFEDGTTFKDIVHGEMGFRENTMRFVDTPQFQRLRGLKQLGCSEYVFHNAHHTRFEHSLGVAFKSSAVAQRLILMGKSSGEDWACMSSKQERASWVKCVEIAGLCHDLGHGPFSHVFDNEFLPRVLGQDAASAWSHEHMGTVMLDKMVEDGGGLDAFGVDTEELSFIKDLITCASDDGGKAPSYGQRFLYDIVANKNTGIDVDKWDYLARDAHYCNIPYAQIDVNKLGSMVKVIDDEICYEWGKWDELSHMFQARASMHRKVYKNPKVKAVEFMVVDALLEADPVMKISEKIHDPDQYLKLEDDVLRDIEKSTDQDLQTARDIVKRIRQRKFYQFVDETFVYTPNMKKPSAQDICNCLVTGDKRTLRAEDVVVFDYKVDYGMKSQNPLERVSFYEKNGSCARGPSVKFRKEQHEMSTMLPKQMSERKFHLFVKDKSKMEQAANAFSSWVRRNEGELQINGNGEGASLGDKRQRL